MQKFLETWRFQVNGVWLNPASATVRVRPHLLERIYPDLGLHERICLLDHLGALVIELQGRGLKRGVWWPVVDLRPVRQPRRTRYLIRWCPEDRLLLMRGDRSITGSPTWLGLSANVPLIFESQPLQEKTVYRRGRLRGVMAEGYPYQPGGLSFRFRNGRARFLCLTGHQPEELRDQTARILPSARRLILRKKGRLEKLLSGCPVHTEDARLNAALAWARISLDALIMHQSGPGIYAGFPWFANYWGRDTCLSLPGATWVTGQFSLARKLLLSLADQQDVDHDSRTYGRIPNLLEPGTRLYNTADGTLWFVRQVEEYGRYSGDRAALRRLFPTVRRALEGEIRSRTDEHGLVRHGPAETWMDAGGDVRPVTPRDDRAVEIQALWVAALCAGTRLATLFGHAKLANRWSHLAGRVRKIFPRLYWDQERGYLYDHLNPDGSPDRQIRPNALLALTAPAERLLSSDQERSVLQIILDRLTTDYGVCTLDPDDDQFRPQHLGGRRYHFDQAYHNGDVWPWLTGPLMTALTRRPDLKQAQVRIQALTGILTQHILDKGSVGTLSELFNAVPIEENDNEAGAYSQAWSLAEYIRVIHQDYLGIHPDVLNSRVVIEPAVPNEWGTTRFHFAAGGDVVAVVYHRKKAAQRFQFHLRKGNRPLTLLLRLRLPDQKFLLLQHDLKPERCYRIEVAPDGKEWKASVNNKMVPISVRKYSHNVSSF
jgi:glycogen debranching enzyme